MVMAECDVCVTFRRTMGKAGAWGVCGRRKAAVTGRRQVCGQTLRSARQKLGGVSSQRWRWQWQRCDNMQTEDPFFGYVVCTT